MPTQMSICTQFLWSWNDMKWVLDSNVSTLPPLFVQWCMELGWGEGMDQRRRLTCYVKDNSHLWYVILNGLVRSKYANVICTFGKRQAWQQFLMEWLALLMCCTCFNFNVCSNHVLHGFSRRRNMMMRIRAKKNIELEREWKKSTNRKLIIVLWHKMDSSY